MLPNDRATLLAKCDAAEAAMAKIASTEPLYGESRVFYDVIEFHQSASPSTVRALVLADEERERLAADFAGFRKASDEQVDFLTLRAETAERRIEAARKEIEEQVAEFDREIRAASFGSFDDSDEFIDRCSAKINVLRFARDLLSDAPDPAPLRGEGEKK